MGPPRGLRLFVMNRVKAYPMRRSSSILVATALTCFSSNSARLLAAERTWLVMSVQVRTRIRWVSLRSFHIAESRTFDLNVWLSLSSSFDNLVPDMLSFTIAIRPDDE